MKILSGSPHAQKQERIKVVIETENLLWGIIPEYYPIKLNERLELDKYRAAGAISIKSYQTIMQKTLMILSFGVYIPESLEFEFWGEYVLTE